MQHINIRNPRFLTMNYNEYEHDEYKSWLVKNSKTGKTHYEPVDDIINPVKINITRQMLTYNINLQNKRFNLISYIFKLISS